MGREVMGNMDFIVCGLTQNSLHKYVTYLHSSSFQAILIPFPPPPADAFIITG